MSYHDDVRSLRRGPVDDGTLRWLRATGAPAMSVVAPGRRAVPDY